MTRNHQRGLTLIELMIVVAVIGIIAAIAIPQYQTYVFKSHVQRVVGEAGALKPALELCILSGRMNIGDPATAGNCDPQATGSNLQATAGNASPTIAVTWATAGSGVPEVSLSATAPTTIIATFGNVAGSALKTGPGTITWTRSLDMQVGQLRRKVRQHGLPPVIAPSPGLVAESMHEFSCNARQR